MKRDLIIFIVGGIIFSSISIFAYSYNASDISYSPSNNSWKVNNVKSAIDSIKTTNDTTIANLQSSNSNKDQTIESLNSQITTLQNKEHIGTTYSNYISSNSAENDKSITLQIPKGKYVCSSTMEIAGVFSSTIDSYTNETRASEVSGCSNLNYISYIKGGKNGKTALNSGSYVVIISRKVTFSCEVNNTTTITALHTSNSANTSAKYPQTIDIDCTKIE